MILCLGCLQDWRYWNSVVGRVKREEFMVIINTSENFFNDEYKVIPVSQNNGENILVTLT